MYKCDDFSHKRVLMSGCAIQKQVTLASTIYSMSAVFACASPSTASEDVPNFTVCEAATSRSRCVRGTSGQKENAIDIYIYIFKLGAVPFNIGFNLSSRSPRSSDITMEISTEFQTNGVNRFFSNGEFKR